MTFNKIILSVAILSSLLIATPDVSAADADTTVSYIPKIHGVMRPRLEVGTKSGDFRFQLRNARVSLEGKISRQIDYYLQVDFCDRGSIRPLDFWARAAIFKGFSLQMGQFRMPFGFDPHRGPANYFFANRSFVGKQVCNYRAVGGKATYAVPNTRLKIEAGIFSPNSISDHKKWARRVAASGKLTYDVGNVSMTTGYMTVSPEKKRANMIDAAVCWKSGRWTVEGEYIYEMYPGSDLDGTHAYDIWGNYRFPLKSKLFNAMSVQARFDGMTAHSSLVPDDAGKISLDQPRRNRITIGTTISHLTSKYVFFDVRLNYEKYLYSKGVLPALDEDDKAVLELVVKF